MASMMLGPRRTILLGRAAANRVKTRLAAMPGDQRGVSAVEFSLLAPILLGGLLSMIDIGLAVTERMNLDHVLRAGAQAAMAEKSKEQILKVIEATASEHFTLAESQVQTHGENPVVISVKCVCSEASSSPGEECGDCTKAPQAHVYYELSAEKLYNGILFKDLTLKANIEVQAR